MFYFNIIIYLTIFSSIIGCDCTRLSEEPLTDLNLSPKQDEGNPVIVLFHGLHGQASCFDSLKENLEQAFPHASVVALSSVERINTAVNSIKEQANSSFQELAQIVSGDLRNSTDLRNRPTLLIGHSQGGLRAYTMFDLFNDLLNIKGIVTLGTPWEGAPILNADQNLLLTYCQHPHVLGDMEAFSTNYRSDDKDFLRKYLEDKVLAFKNANSYAGVLALKPKSNFLNWVAHTLPTVSIPILAIGGTQSDFNIFLSEAPNYDFRHLNHLWTSIIVGTTYHGENQKHDMLVPLYSQLARNIVKGNKNFQREVIEDALHDELLALPPEQAYCNILKHPEAFEKIEQFARKVLYAAPSQKTHIF